MRLQDTDSVPQGPPRCLVECIELQHKRESRQESIIEAVDGVSRQNQDAIEILQHCRAHQPTAQPHYVRLTSQKYANQRIAIKLVYRPLLEEDVGLLSTNQLWCLCVNAIAYLIYQ